MPYHTTFASEPTRDELRQHLYEVGLTDDDEIEAFVRARGPARHAARVRAVFGALVALVSIREEHSAGEVALRAEARVAIATLAARGCAYRVDGLPGPRSAGSPSADAWGAAYERAARMSMTTEEALRLLVDDLCLHAEAPAILPLLAAAVEREMRESVERGLAAAAVYAHVPLVYREGLAAARAARNGAPYFHVRYDMDGVTHVADAILGKGGGRENLLAPGFLLPMFGATDE